jgi:hypothetical protein
MACQVYSACLFVCLFLSSCFSLYHPLLTTNGSTAKFGPRPLPKLFFFSS